MKESGTKQVAGGARNWMASALSSPATAAKSIMGKLGSDFQRTSDDTLMMYCFKVIPCPKRYRHDWKKCAYAHPTEKARRRDPLAIKYLSVFCPEERQGVDCPRGESCPLAHNVFEFWLHPSRYRTVLCKDGLDCKRAVCFFAHTDGQLRQSSASQAEPSDFEMNYDGTLLQSENLEGVMQGLSQPPDTCNVDDDDTITSSRSMAVAAPARAQVAGIQGMESPSLHCQPSVQSQAKRQPPSSATYNTSTADSKDCKRSADQSHTPTSVPHHMLRVSPGNNGVPAELPAAFNGSASLALPHLQHCMTATSSPQTVFVEHTPQSTAWVQQPPAGAVHATFPTDNYRTGSTTAAWNAMACMPPTVADGTTQVLALLHSQLNARPSVSSALADATPQLLVPDQPAVAALLNHKAPALFVLPTCRLDAGETYLSAAYRDAAQVLSLQQQLLGGNSTWAALIAAQQTYPAPFLPTILGDHALQTVPPPAHLLTPLPALGIGSQNSGALTGLFPHLAMGPGMVAAITQPCMACAPEASVVNASQPLCGVGLGNIMSL